jgi:hypothetical protein
VNAQNDAILVDSQVEALLQRVTQTSQQRCAELRAAADSQAHEIIRSGRAEALASIRKAVSEERSRIAHGVRLAEAHAELEARQRAQRETRILLNHIWSDLPDALLARWSDPEQRRSWIDAALAQAHFLIGGQSWILQHGADWTQEDRRRSETPPGQEPSQQIEWELDAGIKAGIRVRTDRVCLDATVGGLLARRAQIEADFLAEYLALEPPVAPASSSR